MVKDEIHEIVFVADEDLTLAVFETEAATEFELEGLQVVEQGGFEVRFLDRLARSQP